MSCLGLARTGLLLLVFDYAQLGFLLFARSSSRLGFSLLVSELTHFDLPASPHGYTCFGPSLLLSGLSRAGFVFLLPVVDHACMGFFMFPRQFAQLAPVVSVLAYSNMGFSSLLQDRARLGLSSLVLGATRLDSSFSVFAASQIASSPPSRSLARLELPLSIPDVGHVDLPMFLRDLSCFEPILSVMGLTCTGFVFSLFSP